MEWGAHVVVTAGQIGTAEAQILAQNSKFWHNICFVLFIIYLKCLHIVGKCGMAREGREKCVAQHSRLAGRSDAQIFGQAGD